MMPNFWHLPINPILKIQLFPLPYLWVCWFLGKNLSNFVTPIWKPHDPYCHTVWAWEPKQSHLQFFTNLKWIIEIKILCVLKCFLSSFFVHRSIIVVKTATKLISFFLKSFPIISYHSSSFFFESSFSFLSEVFFLKLKESFYWNLCFDSIKLGLTKSTFKKDLLTPNEAKLKRPDSSFKWLDFIHSITSANIQIESIQRCMVGRWIALDNLSQIHFERNRASAIICSVDQKPLFRLFLAGPSEPGAWGGQ